MRYAVVIEKGERNFSAYVPDLPGCVSVGETLEDVKAPRKRLFEEEARRRRLPQASADWEGLRR